MGGQRVRRNSHCDAFGGETETEVDVLSIEEVPLVEPVDVTERGARDEQARAGQGSRTFLSARPDLGEPERSADPELARQQHPGREV
jgi:hypothetical protein